ncbi:MAG TPA: glycosyltransferase family 2 protein [Acidobacteriaceae bacterium]|nr:glycosyltransferase family 2 protein [Acidobacteriaceae bacterium]
MKTAVGVGPAEESIEETGNALDLAVVVPTYQERENIAEFIRRLGIALAGLSWELIFVDDDSPDETAEVVRQWTSRDRRVRLLHRIGRRGLSSACIEGIMATSAECVAVMDADMQHDEALLPRMLEQLREDSLDVVIGTRNSDGGSMGEFPAHRVLLSKVGQWVSRAVCRCELSDPMSGFFLVRRGFFLKVVRHLQGNGFKILVDMLASSPRPVRLAEMGYEFRRRTRGESKLCVHTGVEYLLLVISKLMGGLLPVRFAAFALVGAIGLATHLAVLAIMLYGFHLHFIAAQAIAATVAMIENFFLNNLITYRDRSLRGLRWLTGLASFCVACSFGAWANVIVARSLYAGGLPWYAAGMLGTLLSAVWNYSVTSLFTWQTPRRTAVMQAAVEPLAADLEPYR